MAKIKKIVGIAITVLLVVSVSICLILGIQVMQGKQPSLLGYHFYHVLSGSMEPTIDTNANVVVKKVDTDTLVVGDIITFSSRDTAIYGKANTHRIIEITTDENGATCYITQGDANPVADSYYVYPEDVYGKVVFYTSAVYWITVYFKFVQTLPGFITSIMMPLLIVGYFFIRDFKKSIQDLIEAQAEIEVQAEDEAEVEVQAEVEEIDIEK